MTIHTGHPFQDAEDQVRRFRGRLGGAVSLWTSGSGPGSGPGAGRAGLTVSSVMVANGDPALLVGLLDPDSDLLAVLEQTGRGVVHLLEWGDRALADAFGGVAPAPGGPFTLGDWEQTDHGPVLDRTRALVGLAEVREAGWSALVTVTIDEVVVLPDEEPLEHRRGRYRVGSRL